MISMKKQSSSIKSIKARSEAATNLRAANSDCRARRSLAA
jgi:hypothetical protein